MIQPSPWDSAIINLSAGKIPDYRKMPIKEDLLAFVWVSVRIPQFDIGAIQAYEDLGFHFVTVDYRLRRRGLLDVRVPDKMSCFILCKQPLDAEVRGFVMENSRLHIDPLVRRYLRAGFWDDLVKEHAAEFADEFIGIAEDGRLAGFASCFRRIGYYEIFWLQVHTDFQKRGVGRALLSTCAHAAAGGVLETSVISQNLAGINYYFRSGFEMLGGEVVMHYFKEQGPFRTARCVPIIHENE